MTMIPDVTIVCLSYRKTINKPYTYSHPEERDMLSGARIMGRYLNYLS